ncbi:unnamed protein product [Withania somnifera]
MELKPGLSALVTGGASGIGKALSLALAQKGVFVTIVDFSEEKGIEVAALAEKECATFHSGLNFPAVMFVRCDVTNTGELKAAFRKHFVTYGGLDICINSAGIGDIIPFGTDQTDGSKSWRHTINVNLIGVIDSTRLAIQAMQTAQKPGVIINLGSASGLYPMYGGSIYSASKGGVVMFTRSLAPFKRQRIRINVLCPEVNFSSGRYFSGNGNDISSLLPPDYGFEAVGIIVAIGDAVRNLKIGMPAAIMTFGGYAEFVMVPAKHILPIAKPDPEVLAMLTSGLTASIALEKAAQMESGKVVLVTAAAGATGQFAVQLAKLAGNTVVATCGGNEKAKLLKDLGVDRIIDYKTEDIKAVLKEEFPKGTDIVYESVGGEMFDICLNALAVYGRLVVIGMISQYQGEHGWKPRNYPGICEKLLAKSQTVIAIDPKQFIGLQSVADAVEYLHSGKSAGKVVVCIDPTYVQQLAKL